MIAFILLFEGNCEIRAHILFAVHCGSGEEVLIVNGAQTDVHSLCKSLLLFPEDCLNLCDCGAESEAVQRVVLLILAENGVEVLHDSSAEDCSGNMDNRVDVGKVDVDDSVALYEAVAGADGVESCDVISGCDEVIGISCRKSSTADGCDAVLNLALVGGNAAAARLSQKVIITATM